MMKILQKQSFVFVKSFCFLFPTLLIAAFVLFYSVIAIFRGIAFGLNDSPIWVRFLYWGVDFREIIETPIIYLSSISLVSALVGSFWTAFIIPRFSRFIFLQIIFVPWIAVILTGPIWGLIWSVNRWPSEVFGSFEVMMLYRRTDMGNGFLSCLSAAQSYPLNIFSYLAFCGLLLINKKIFIHNKDYGA